MNACLVDSNLDRIRRVEDGEQIVVGINKYVETEPSPPATGEDGGILVVDPGVEAQQIEELQQWRSSRDQAAVDKALEALARVAGDESENIMPATIAAARAG